ncbi:unnamed protein product [Rotaria sp. Silwood2]|nr:unnamed protein product [Rotaria sp. Silwood2]CAF3323027.1 unnamed protein product [Rotaria sp. Silwood2]CAF4380496.1 unnamed protein product [Rotaria sp. Silwood2]CAF4386545.1 unnamed protein product [Rotaria sp. Silwood2]
MTKLLVCITLLLLALVSAYGGPHRRPPNRGHWHHPSDDSNEDSWVSNICANDTLTQSFLNQTRQLINDLQSNGSFTQVLQERAQFISYIQNDNNTELFLSNCTEYFNGLKSAKILDKQALEQEKQYEQIANRLFRQIIQSFIEPIIDSDED